MTVRFQADADFNGRIVAGALRREPAVDIRSAVEAGLSGLADQEVLAVAATASRVLLTHDLKTMPRHFAEFTATETSSGVVIIPQSMPIGLAVEHLLVIWAASDAAEWTNRLYVVPR